MLAKRLVPALLCTLCMAAPAAQLSNSMSRGEQFVSQLSVKGGHLAWEGVRPGMSQPDVEERLGKLTPKPSTSGRGAYTHEAVVTRDGVRVQLGFYMESSHPILTEIALTPSGLTQAQVVALRKTAKARLRSLRDSGPEFPFAAPGGEELDIAAGVVRVQIGSDGE